MGINPQKDEWLSELFLNPAMQPKPSSSGEPELFLAVVPEKPVLYYSLFSSARQWGAQFLEPDSALVFELSDFGKPWRENSKTQMIQALKEAFSRYEVCHVTRELLEKTRMDRESQIDKGGATNERNLAAIAKEKQTDNNNDN